MTFTTNGAGCLFLIFAFGGCGHSASPPADLGPAIAGDMAVDRARDLSGTGDLAPFDVLDLAAGCAAPASPNASISGTAPLGPFSGNFAWLGDESGSCASQAVVRVTKGADAQSPTYLVLGWSSPPVLGPQAVSVSLVDNGTKLGSSGTVTLTAIEPAGSTPITRLAGTLAVNELGGKLVLMGSFAADHCALLDGNCP
jgi:hypothetical protein